MSHYYFELVTCYCLKAVGEGVEPGCYLSQLTQLTSLRLRPCCLQLIYCPDLFDSHLIRQSFVIPHYHDHDSNTEPLVVYFTIGLLVVTIVTLGRLHYPIHRCQHLPHDDYLFAPEYYLSILKTHQSFDAESLLTGEDPISISHAASHLNSILSPLQYVTVDSDHLVVNFTIATITDSYCRLVH